METFELDLENQSTTVVAKTRTPRSYDAILAGALSLPLEQQVKIAKALKESISKAANAARILAEETAKLSREL